jgi:hypothetical protein
VFHKTIAANPDAVKIASGNSLDFAKRLTVSSYLGILSHANQHALSQAVKNAYWVRNQCD